MTGSKNQNQQDPSSLAPASSASSLGAKTEAAFSAAPQTRPRYPKQVIVMRHDLKMRLGKQIAQGAHASMKVILDCPSEERTLAMREWLSGTFTKICVRCHSEAELLELQAKALAAGLPCSLIQDAGRTEFGGVPTYTCIAICPAYQDEIDPITGKLELL